MADPKLKSMLEAGQFIVAPGVYDLVSVHLANDVGFDAVYASGYWMTASALGLPDLGLATYTEMIDRVARIAEFSRAPVIADADTGYGGLVNLHRTVRGYEKRRRQRLPARGPGLPEEVRPHPRPSRDPPRGDGAEDPSGPRYSCR